MNELEGGIEVIRLEPGQERAEGNQRNDPRRRGPVILAQETVSHVSRQER